MSCKLLKGLERFWKVLKGLERSWKVLKGLERFWNVLKGPDAVLKVLEVLKRSWKFFKLSKWYFRSWEVLKRSVRLLKDTYCPQKILIDLERLLKVPKYQGWSLKVLKGQESASKITSLYQSYSCFGWLWISSSHTHPCSECFVSFDL